MNEPAGRFCLTTYLAISTTILVFGIFGILMYKEVPDKSQTAITMAIGIIIGKWGSIIDYFFGSSSGSAAKSKAIETMVAEDKPGADRLSDEKLLEVYAKTKDKPKEMP